MAIQAKKRWAATVAGVAVVGSGLAILAPAAGAAAAAQGSTPAAAAVQPNCTMSGTGGLQTLNTAGQTNGTVDVLDSLAQVLPAKHFAGAAGATLCSARDAYASFQIEVSASQGAALSNLAMTASALTGPGGASIPGTASGAVSDIQFDREDYVTLSRLSDAELDPAAGSLDTVSPAASRVSRNETTGVCTDTADACQFPDELIPDRDSIFGETRNAFQSLTVPSGQNRVVWVDVFVPTGTTPGAYTGTVTITQSTGRAATVPVSLTVSPATLPATSTMDSAFFYEGPNNNPAGYQEAAELGLDDRISVVPDGVVGGGTTGPQTVLAPLLDGTDPKVKLQDASGKRGALTDLPMSAMWDSFASYKSLFTNATTAKAWAYCDEWGYTECAQAYAAHAATEWPGIPVLAIDAAVPSSDAAHAWADPETQAVPTQLSSILGGVVDLQQLMEPAEGWLKAVPQYNADTSDRSKYLDAWASAATGRQVWTYLSSMSGSSTYAPTVAGTVGYASYGIDQIASEQLATGWQSFNDGTQGELYWSVNQPISSSLNTASTGLTGDGTLFYAYNAAQVGGQDSIPLESIRLKRIRNGQQDYELLHLATAQGLTLSDGRTAHSIASTLFPSLSQSAATPAAVDAAEQDVIRLFTPASRTKPVNAHDLNCDGNPDFLAVQNGTGKLLFFPRTTTDWTPNAPITVGTGFGTTTATMTYTSLLLPGDVNGDGSPDLLGRKADGSMWLMPGNCTGAFGPAVPLGFTTTNPTAVGDFNGDGHPDLFDKHTDGTLWLLAGNGTGTFSAATQAGAGWGGLQITGVGDFNNDGAVDVVARESDGTQLLYEGTGTDGWKTVYAGANLGLTLPPAGYPSTFGVGDLNGDGNADLVAIDSAGTMWLYAGNGGTGLSTTATRIGGGWSSTNLLEVAA